MKTVADRHRHPHNNKHELLRSVNISDLE